MEAMLQALQGVEENLFGAFQGRFKQPMQRRFDRGGAHEHGLT
jgi:hypothetical protein